MWICDCVGHHLQYFAAPPGIILCNMETKVQWLDLKAYVFQDSSFGKMQKNREASCCCWRNSLSVCHTLLNILQGCGSATWFCDCSTKKKIKKTCSHLITWRPVAPAGIKPGQTQNLCFVDYTKCRSTLLIRIWILGFCLCTALFFLPYSVEQNLTLTLVVFLRSCLPCFARYRRPGDFMKILLSLFSIFCHP